MSLFLILNLKTSGKSKSVLSVSSSIVPVSYSRVCKNHHDKAAKFVYLLVHSSPASLSSDRQYLAEGDWDYLVQDIIDTHPGLKFLREAREFHSRYIKTVVARVFYNCNRSWSMKLTISEIRRSNFIQVRNRLNSPTKIHFLF